MRTMRTKTAMMKARDDTQALAGVEGVAAVPVEMDAGVAV